MKTHPLNRYTMWSFTNRFIRTDFKDAVLVGVINRACLNFEFSRNTDGTMNVTCDERNGDWGISDRMRVTVEEARQMWNHWSKIDALGGKLEGIYK